MYTQIKLNSAKVNSTGMFPLAQRVASKNILNKFLDEMPEGTIAYIAGGAPRDWHHGIGCRDIDIFFHVPDEFRDSTTVMLENMYQTLHHNYHGYDYEGGQGIMSVHEFDASEMSRSKTMQFRKVQLIRLDRDPMSVITDFPISLSRIWMGIDGLIYCDDAYKDSYNNRIIREMHNKQYNYVYLNKILGRFDKYAFVPNTYRSLPEDQHIA